MESEDHGVGRAAIDKVMKIYSILTVQSKGTP